MAAAGLNLAAWALWLGGWYGFGAWGLQHWPLAAGGLGALALWLALLAGLQVLQRWWALGPLCAGAGVTAAVAALSGLPAPWPAALAAAALLLPLARAAGWRRCALLPLSRAPGADPAGWPRWAAAAAMLPMMAGLPAMASWCSAAGWPLPVMLGLHAVLMLGPVWLGPAQPGAGLIAATMVAGAAALLFQPDLGGLMLASLLQALACGWAWRAPVQPAPRRLLAPVWTAAAVWALGAAMALAGPAALAAVHVGLGGLAALGAGLVVWRQAFSRRPQPR